MHSNTSSESQDKLTENQDCRQSNQSESLEQLTLLDHSQGGATQFEKAALISIKHKN